MKKQHFTLKKDSGIVIYSLSCLSKPDNNNKKQPTKNTTVVVYINCALYCKEVIR